MTSPLLGHARSSVLRDDGFFRVKCMPAWSGLAASHRLQIARSTKLRKKEETKSAETSDMHPTSPDIFLRSSRPRVDMLSYESKPTDK